MIYKTLHQRGNQRKPKDIQYNDQKIKGQTMIYKTLHQRGNQRKPKDRQYNDQKIKDKH